METVKQKESIVIVYTGEGKGKTSASLGLVGRALGHGSKVAFIQFVKAWEVSEHKFLRNIQSLYNDQLFFYKGGKGFYNAGDLSAKGVSEDQHKQAAHDTYKVAMEAVKSGKYDMVICDEINNALHDGLLKEDQVKALITKRHPSTSLCLTGRNFPDDLLPLADIATNMTKIKHHYDDGYLAQKGIDY